MVLSVNLVKLLVKLQDKGIVIMGAFYGTKIMNGEINPNRNMMLTSYYNCVKNCPDKLKAKLTTSNAAYLMNGIIHHIVRYLQNQLHILLA